MKKTPNNRNGNQQQGASLIPGAPERPDQQKKYDRFLKSGIKYIDYKDPAFLLKLINDQGKIYPRRLTGTSSKFQRKVAQAVKRARHIAMLPYVADALK